MRVAPTAQLFHLDTTHDDLANDLLSDYLQSLGQFIQRLERYDGSREAFRIIVSESINRFEVSPMDMATKCRHNRSTVKRWVTGSFPTEPARAEVVKRLKAMLEERLADLVRATASRPNDTDVEAHAHAD